MRHSDRNTVANTSVIILCPGGLENGGGIGRQMGYFLQARETIAGLYKYRVVDTRGPWFLGDSPLCIGFAGLYLVTALLKLAKARFFCGLRVVHANITGRGSTLRKVILLTLARGFGLRYLLHVHDYNYADEYRRHGAFMRSLIAATFRRAAKILVLGSRDREALLSLLQLPQHQIVVLPNAVPDPLPRGIEARHPRGRPCHFLFLGHLGERKGVPELLHALARPALICRRWRATLAGDGPVDKFRQPRSRFRHRGPGRFPGLARRDTGRVIMR